MTRVWNFSAGPGALPESVLKQAAEEMLDWRGAGMGVMEMSHRGKEFLSIYEAAERDLRELLAVPANYKILFLQGGGIGENAEAIRVRALAQLRWLPGHVSTNVIPANEEMTIARAALKFLAK